MKSILNEDLNYVVFTKNAKTVSDFDVEKAYQKLKDIKYVQISNQTLLMRFLVGVKRKEITPFNCIVHDLDGKIFEGIANELGELTGNCWDSEILNVSMNYAFELI